MRKVNKNKGISRPPFSKKWKENISKSKKGCIPWNKGKKGLQIAWNKNKKTGPLSETHKRKIGLGNIGKIMSKEARIKISKNNSMKRLEVRKKVSIANIGKRHSEETLKKMRGRIMKEETKRKISELSLKRGIKPPSRKGIPHSIESKVKIGNAQRGNKNWNWKGGVSPLNQKIRGSLEYHSWQNDIFKLNNHCKKCGEIRISKLVAHHILNFSNHPELRFDINNGITLCKSCHKEFHHKYGRKDNTLEQVRKFLLDK